MAPKQPGMRKHKAGEKTMGLEKEGGWDSIDPKIIFEPPIPSPPKNNEASSLTRNVLEKDCSSPAVNAQVEQRAPRKEK
ncbi:unnamed protein product [Boreogadus saida]